MDYIVRGFKYLMGSGSAGGKVEVEGHVLATDATAGRSFVLVKENERTWQSRWMKTDEIIVRPASQSLNTIFSGAP
jgi:hypothetical protein